MSRYCEKARENPSVKKGENGDKTGTHCVSIFAFKTTFWYLLVLAVDFLQSVDCIASSLWGKRGQKAGSWQSHNLIPVQNKSKQSNSDDSARWDSLGKHKSNDKGSLHRICSWSILKHLLSCQTRGVTSVAHVCRHSAASWNAEVTATGSSPFTWRTGKPKPRPKRGAAQIASWTH